MKSIFRQFGTETSQPFPLIVDGTEQQFFDVFFLQGLQFKDHRAGQQRPIDLKVRVLCSSTDKDDRTIFHKGQQVVLLSLVKTMDLIDKQNGTATIHALQFLGMLHDLFHVLFAGDRGIDLGKFALGGAGDDLSQGGLARAGRAIEDHIGDATRIAKTADDTVFAKKMGLPDDIVEGIGSDKLS